jgi:hypothetical protein
MQNDSIRFSGAHRIEFCYVQRQTSSCSRRVWLRRRLGCPAVTPPAATSTCRTPLASGPAGATCQGAGARKEPMATPASRAAASSLLSQVKPVVKVTIDRHWRYLCLQMHIHLQV